MCLAIPMKLTKVSPPMATGEAAGLSQEIRIDFIQAPAPGDYVMVHAGFAIQKMSEEQALENMRFLEDIKDAL